MRTGMEFFPVFRSFSMSRKLFKFNTATDKNPQPEAGIKI